MRKPPGYRMQRPGGLVQIDTLDIEILPGVQHQHCTARDVISRRDVLDIHSRATAAPPRTASWPIWALTCRSLFSAIQIDGGAEFRGAFEQQCRLHQIKLFVLPPRSPKRGGSVESAQRTHTEEFSQVYELPWRTGEIRPRLQRWQDTGNDIRPHQSLAQPLAISARHSSSMTWR